MAKKTKQSKTKPPKKGKAAGSAKGSAPRAKKGAGAEKPRSRGPRQQALIEDARIKPLDDVAASIAEVREEANKLRTEEKGYLATARQLMHKYGKSVYKHAGVEIVLIPGDEKVRVRILNDDGDASATGASDRPSDAGGDQVREDAVSGDRTGSDESAEG